MLKFSESNVDRKKDLERARDSNLKAKKLANKRKLELQQEEAELGLAAAKDEPAASAEV